MINLKNSFLLVCGIVMGIGLSNLFSGCGDGNTPSIVSVKNLKPIVIRKEEQKSEVTYIKRLDSLNANCNKLNRQLVTTRHSLSSVKQTNLVLQDQIFQILDDQNHSPDSGATKRDCDSLGRKITGLIQNENIKDSLYEDLTLNLQMQLQNKDSAWALKDQQYQSLKTLFDKSLDDQDALYKTNRALEKKYKRQRFKNKLFMVGSIILSGAAAAIILTPH